MLKKFWILVLAGLLGMWGVVGCDDEPTDGDADADSDSDTDADGDMDGDVDGDTDSDADGDGGGNGWPCTQANGDMPQFRLTSLEVSDPQALAQPLIQGILDGALDGFGFVWLMDVDVANGTMDTGGGNPAAAAPEYDDAEFCQASWNSDATYAPIEDIAITVTGETFSTTDPVPAITIPVYSEGSLLLALPLANLELTDVVMSENRSLIGAPEELGTEEVAGDWTEAGTLSAYIEYNNAEAIEVTGVGTLCSLLCVSGAQDCQNVKDPATDCGTAPETIPGTSDVGWELTAQIGASAVAIQ